MHPAEEEFRARREKEAREYEKGKYIARLIMGGYKVAHGYFKLIHIPTGVTEDRHTGDKKEIKQACLVWSFEKDSKDVYPGYKFNPFPLDDVVDMVFSDVEKVWNSL